MSNLWVKVLALAVAAIAAALLLKAAPPIVVLAVFAVAIVVAWVRLRRSRSSRTGAADELPNLRREAGDPFGLVAYPLGIFGRATEPAVADVVWGRWRTLDVHAFELSFVPRELPTGDRDEPPGRGSFSCAMTRIEPALPGTVVEPKEFMVSLNGPPPDASLEVGEAAFDGSANVWSEDEVFARRLLDPPTREWFASLEQRWGFEVRGNLVLAYGPAEDLPDPLRGLETLRAVLARLPSDEGASRPPAV